MPRFARLDAPGVLHHVMGRGIERKEIFLSKNDKEDFIIRLSELAEDGSMDIYAWALLPNHFHLLCKTKNRPLSSSMRKLMTGYAVNFNKRHDRHGHLFQNRYKSIICQEDGYLLELIRYIHLNLLRSGLVKDMGELNRSPWSGHSALVGTVASPWQDTRYVLSFFGTGGSAKERYLAFVERGMGQGSRPELVGGGLIRSMGGWAEVMALRKRGNHQKSDQRILGDDEFTKRILSQVKDLAKESLRLAPAGKRDLPALLNKICEVHRVSPRELRSGSRRREIVKARRVFSLLAVKELGHSGAEVARYLGVTNSCVTRSVSSGGLPQKGKYG